MKQYLSLFFIALMFCAVVSAGCGGGSDNTPADSEQTENLNEDTGSYDPNEEGRGNSGTVTDLSTISARQYTAHDREILTGTLGKIVKISIADGATVTLRNAIINGEAFLEEYKWGGINCEGNATIILEGTNSVRGFHKNYPGIHVPEGKTLTIKGDGKLTASSNGIGAGIGGGRELSCGNIVIDGGTISAIGGIYAAGIGSGYRSKCASITIISGKITAIGGARAAAIGGEPKKTCGNIIIEGGVIKATGGDDGAGIGSGYASSCGNITISGGTIKATGGENAAGIGSGYWGATCGSVTIDDTCTKVTATKGKGASYSIGKGERSSCGTVTVGGKVGAISESPYTYEP